MSVLVTDGVSVSFGGVRAVRDVSIEVGDGEIVGLIGPNGAGKTTFMDCVSGHRRPDGGRVVLLGRDVTGEPAAFRSWLGLGRSFQDCRLFPSLTVLETLVVHQERHQPSALFGSLVAWPSTRRKLAAKTAAADDLIERMGLTRWRDVPVGELSTGTRRVCDVACLLLSRPRVLLLDEPAAGIAQKETEALGPLIRYVRDDLGCSILLIEHDMPTVFSLSDRVVAMESGAVIAEGPPEAVRNDPRVVASYLGTSEAVIQRSGRRAPANSPS